MLNVLKIYESLRRGRIPPIREIPEPLLDAVATLGHLRGRVTPLTSLERVLTAFRHKEPDRVPVTPVLCAGARQIAGIPFPEYAQDARRSAEVFSAGFEFVGGDLVILMLDLSVEAADLGQKMVFPEDSTPRPDYTNPRIRDVPEYRKLGPVELSRAPRMQMFLELCRLMVQRVGFRAVVTGFAFGPLGVLGMMRGAERLFKDCVHYPAEVMAACETVTSVLIEFVEAQCDTGVPAVALDTLYASGNGLSKELWEKIEGPFVRELSRAIKRKGALVGVHNCGHDLYFDAQIRTMEPEVISFAHLPDDCRTPGEMKERYGDRVTLLGYVPTPLLVHGTPQQVMDACRKQIDDLARDGGYVLAPGCEYPPNIPLTNAFALVKAAERHG